MAPILYLDHCGVKTACLKAGVFTLSTDNKLRVHLHAKRSRSPLSNLRRGGATSSPCGMRRLYKNHISGENEAAHQHPQIKTRSVSLSTLYDVISRANICKRTGWVKIHDLWRQNPSKGGLNRETSFRACRIQSREKQNLEKFARKETKNEYANP